MATHAQLVGHVVLSYALVATCCASLSLLLPVHVGVQNRASCGSPLQVALHREATIDPARLFGNDPLAKALVALGGSRPATLSHARCWESARRRSCSA